MDAGAVDALVGAGAGALLTAGLAYLGGFLRRRRSSRTAARLIWWELVATATLVREAVESGTIAGSPSSPQMVMWETHAAALADQASSPSLTKLALAYAVVSHLAKGWREATDAPLSAEDREALRGILEVVIDGIRALDPYCRWPQDEPTNFPGLPP
jgi:hypothetical protein